MQVQMYPALQPKVQNLRNEHANFKQQASIGEVLSKTSNQMVELINSNKRVREEKKEMPEDPILEVWSPREEKATDDNHTKFAWGVRRMVKQPNADTKSYWDQDGQQRCEGQGGHQEGRGPPVGGPDQALQSPQRGRGQGGLLGE